MIEKEKTNEIVEGKIKAIYPHITVTGDVDKPYYNIDWYDIKKKTMYRGYSSYDLKLVKKWLQEDFEVVENDIADLINRQQAEIELYRKDQDKLIKERTELKAEIERLTNNKCEDCAGCTQWLCDCSNERAQAIKEYTEKLIFEIVNRPTKANPDGVFYNNGRVDRQNEIIDIIQELASNVNFTSP